MATGSRRGALTAPRNPTATNGATAAADYTDGNSPVPVLDPCLTLRYAS